MNALIKLDLDEQESTNLFDKSISPLEKVRTVSRELYKKRCCSGFLPVNRAKEKRVDCYLFDTTLSKLELAEYFAPIIQDSTPRVEMNSNFTLDWKLIKLAGEVTELLLNECDPECKYNELLKHHLHYIMNSLGNSYNSEAEIYQRFVCAIINKFHRA